MKMAFFELEGWERPILEQKLSGHELVFEQHVLHDGDLAKISDCEVLSVFITSRINADVLSRLPKLKLIATRSTGYDHVDCPTAGARNIAVANVPEYGSNTVAEHTFALLLALSRRIIPGYANTKAGRFSTEGLRGFDLRGKTIGVIGTGNIGLHVIRMALSFGMRVLAYDLFPRKVLADVMGFEYGSLDKVLGESDVITLHCPATKENQHLIRKETISRMKRGVVLINTARGTLVDTHDLLAALENGQIAGAGLDVFEGERAIKEDIEVQATVERNELVAAIEAHRLLLRDNVIVTPHNAFNSDEAVRRILDTTIENILSFIKCGKPANPVRCS